MKNPLKNFNSNWIAVIILVGAFLVSAIRFYHIAGQSSPENNEDGANIIRVAHWQLEPGFREALQWGIDQYNELPKVQQAKIRVIQTPIPERIYSQFMNIHLISGTAPDIAVTGGAIAEGNTGKFYSPIGTYSEAPNPYNADDFQVADLPQDISKFLKSQPWRDTFFDGMQGGFSPNLGDYYGVPICTFGGPRLFYNLTMLKEVKAFALNTARQRPTPAWLTNVWKNDSQPRGYLPEARGIAWLNTEELPQTLGQLLLYCEAVQAYAVAHGIKSLAPISASNYELNDIGNTYEPLFFYNLWERCTLEKGTPLGGLDAMTGFNRGAWDFNDPVIKSYFELAKTFTGYYPSGFLGLDREQAQRRFVQEKAAMIYTGAWDAPGILTGARNKDNPEDRFKVGIAPIPLPSKDERWAEYLTMPKTEADSKGGVPFVINKQTPHFDWALDFLQFITSHRINEGISERTGWLPVIVGAKAPERIAPFSPIVEGVPTRLAIDLSGSNIPPILRNAWTSNFKLFISGDITYEAFADIMIENFENPRSGIQASWQYYLQKRIDNSRANNRTSSVEHLNILLGSEEAESRERAITYYNLIQDEGVQVKHWWHKLHPGEPFPEY